MGRVVKKTSTRNQSQNASQPSTSTGRTRSKIVSSSSSSSDDDSEDDYSPDTPSPNGNSRNTSSARRRGRNSTPEISEDEETKLVAECALYVLVNDQKKYVIKKTDIIKNVLKEHRKKYKDIIEKVQTYLKKVAGLSLEEMADHKGCYILVNEIEKASNFAENSPAEIARYGLTMMVLAVIFMKKDLVYEGDMWKALEKIGIDPDVKHPVVGEVKKFLTQELHKQMYVEYKKENTDPPAFAFSWGPRAKLEVSKLDVLKLVCEIYGDMTVEEWPDQLNQATGSGQSPER